MTTQEATQLKEQITYYINVAEIFLGFGLIICILVIMILKLKQWYKESKQESKQVTHMTRCPTCNAKGFKTTVVLGKSYACKKCSTWWINPDYQ